MQDLIKGSQEGLVGVLLLCFIPMGLLFWWRFAINGLLAAKRHSDASERPKLPLEGGKRPAGATKRGNSMRTIDA
jgi:hypothetical protein